MRRLAVRVRRTSRPETRNSASTNENVSARSALHNTIERCPRTACYGRNRDLPSQRRDILLKTGDPDVSGDLRCDVGGGFEQRGTTRRCRPDPPQVWFISCRQRACAASTRATAISRELRCGAFHLVDRRRRLGGPRRWVGGGRFSKSGLRPSAGSVVAEAVRILAALGTADPTARATGICGTVGTSARVIVHCHWPKASSAYPINATPMVPEVQSSPEPT